MKLKKVICLMASAALVLSMTACGPSKSKNETSTGANEAVIDFASVKLGEDYKDITADLKFVTHKTDAVDDVFQEYIREFQKLYPNVTITYEGITNYADDIMTRLTTRDWGDICMIPTAINKNELGNFFVSYGDKAELEKNYILLNNYSYGGKVYGMPSQGNAQGVLYNRKVYEQAGVTETPKTPDEFLAALQKIKDNTSAIPLYTNFSAGWTMTAWDAYTNINCSGDAEFTSTGLVHGTNPFSKKDDMTGPYAVYYPLYEAVKRGLTEDDPTTTDWEGSKGRMNNGEIGTMVLGSWSIKQVQEAGANSDDIGYMPFPITVDGKQYVNIAPDYCYAVNVNSTEDEKIAAMLYIKWLTEESDFAYDEGGIPIPVGAEYPAAYKDLEEAELLTEAPAPEGEEDLFNDINNDSEVGLNSSPDGPSKIVEAALAGRPTLDEIMEDWNARWTASQDKYGVERN